MSIGRLEATEFYYVSVKAIIWASNGLVSHSNIELKAGDTLNQILLSEGGTKCLVVDFLGIEQEVDHSLETFFVSLATSSREVVFINHNVLEMRIRGYIRKASMQLEPAMLQERGNELVTNYVKSCVRDSFQPFAGGQQLLRSTPISASGLYNASLIISDPQKFLWVCLALASEITKQKVGLSEPVRLLSVSMRACPFAITVGQLTEMKVDTVDQIGPLKKLFDRDELRPLRERRNTNYIYIGDFTMGGTEIKVAQAYADALFSKLDRAVVIGSLFDGSVFSESFSLKYLVRLNDLAPGARYSLNI
jgi:hypothetical protein